MIPSRPAPTAAKLTRMNETPVVPPATDVVAGRYALCDPIDSGGSGTVWRAFDIGRGRYCAAKMLRRREAGQLLRFVREQAVRLDGQHIASPYAWAAEEADVLIATELIDGGSLHQLVGTVGPLAEPTVAVLLDQLLTGLEYVHTAGLVHRDVKPGNVLLGATGCGPVHALLIDFGLAIGTADARLTELGMVIGTPGYLPPELASAEGGPSVVQDLFAAGRTAIAALTAVEPTLGVPQQFSVADPVLQSVLTALVSPDPADRPASAGEARWLLAGARMDPIPRTGAGAAITVGNRLPPLPDGWDPRFGPTSTARMTPARDAVIQRDRPMTVVDPGIALRPAERSGDPASADSRPPRPLSRWPLFVGGGGLLLALAAIVTAIVVRGHPGSSGNPTGTEQGRSGVPGSSGAATAPGSAAAGPRAGEPCDWTRQGESVSGPGGGVTCTLTDDGGYRWTAA